MVGDGGGRSTYEEELNLIGVVGTGCFSALCVLSKSSAIDQEAGHVLCRRWKLSQRVSGMRVNSGLKTFPKLQVLKLLYSLFSKSMRGKEK